MGCGAKPQHSIWKGEELGILRLVSRFMHHCMPNVLKETVVICCKNLGTWLMQERILHCLTLMGITICIME